MHIEYDALDPGAELDTLVPAVLTRLPRILDEVREQLSSAWPDYAEFLAEEHDEVLVAAGAFVQRLVTLVGPDLRRLPSAAASGAEQPLFEEIGRIQWRQGRELTALLGAYQVGARVAWRHVAAAALEAGVAPEALASLAEAVFVFIDQLSSASARGYVLEQSEASAARERMRDELVELLLSGRASLTAVQVAAARASWTIPRQASVILTEPDNVVARGLLARLDGSCLQIHRPGMLGAIVPDPSGPQRREWLSAGLAGAQAVVGHPVPVDRLPASVAIAEVAVQLGRSRVLTDDPIFVEDHLDAIIVHRDGRLLEALRRQCLAPLADLPQTVRDRLQATLAAWLRHQGDRRAVAAELEIHPQTVRYRLTQLTELFGDTLTDPAGRQRLMLCLAWGPD
jgi:PucR C-terminal helix-turn-helix domain